MNEWKKVKIGEIFKIEKGSLQSSKCIPGKYDFITAASEWKTHESYSHECEAIVYAVAASGSLGRAHYVNGKFIASDLCFILTEKDKEKYPINFQFYQLIFEVIREEIVSKTKTGTSKESINQKNFSNYEIPYFSFDYQMANYEKLVNTKQKVSKLLEESEKQKSYVKQLRQNILQEAIEGKLTEEWRKENPVVKGNPDFDAEALFEKIQEEKDLELLRNSKKKVFESIAENEQPFEIPEGWKWVRLGELCNFGNCQSIEPNSLKPNDWILDLEDIEKDTGRIISIRSFFENKSQSTKHIFHKGFVLYSKLRPYLNKVVIAPKNGYCTSEILPLDFGINNNSRYMQIVLMSPYFVSYTTRLSYGMKMPRLGTNDGKNACIPLPPLKEQKEIVSCVEKLLANVTGLEEQISERETLTKQMLQSIMKEAFREG